MVANIFFASSDAALEALVLSAAIVGPTAIAASGTDDAWAVLEPMVLVVLGSTAGSTVGVGVGLDCCCCSGLDDAAMDAARAAADVLTDELVPLRVIATDGAALIMVIGLVKVGAGAGVDVLDDDEIDVLDDEVDVWDDEVDVWDEEVFIEDEAEWGGASTAAAGVTDAPPDLAALSMSTMDRPACWVAVGEARKSGRAAIAAAGGTGIEWVLLAGVD